MSLDDDQYILKSHGVQLAKSVKMPKDRSPLFAELVTDADMVDECTQVAPKSDPHLMRRELVVLRKTAFDLIDAAGAFDAWCSSITRRMIRLRQDPIDWHLLKDIRRRHHRGRH